ncbi:DeoR/GlpR family DNA-binding transcription regulator [Streptococcus sp. DD12]|uniref:DeoR/GlpR family DNA-binding transcription regulator n=1 Tax=Streptococcus sp. DD12 TaxID=1777880 RepID=UPI0007967E13|nr:DeoR/GlpR family DNA-binding transcription regulator [Streptococcus sp. DD12]KXT75486.1 Lactose phosphotransferase system repressor [Streptococcus sp. DD12]
MKENRHVAILNEVDSKGVVTVKELVTLLGVTDMTIRRDLIALEKQGLLVRVHGGAHRKTPDSLLDATRKERDINHIDEKRAIAQTCANLIADGDTVFIGSGTTAALIGDYIGEKKISLVTNSLLLFERVKQMAQIDVFLIGGRYRLKTDTFVGKFAHRALEGVQIAKAFLGTDGISGQDITTNNEEEGAVNAEVLLQAKERYILADASKFTQKGFFNYSHMDQVTGIITDPGLSKDLQARYHEVLLLSS